MSQELIDKIRAASQAKNVDPDVALAIARAESSMRPSAQAGSSSAGGLFQVVDKTWKEYGGKPGKKLDADENIRVGTDIIAKNAQTLKSFLNRDPRPAELYAAHYFGPSGAKTFLSADPNTPIVDVLGKAAVKANPNLQGKNVGQVLAQLETKMGGKPAQQARAPAAAPVQEAAPAPAPMRAAGEPGGRIVSAAPIKSVSRETVASLGPGYQAALALSFLADTDDKEDRDVEKEPGIAEKWLAQTASRPAAMAQFADLKIRSPFAEPEQQQPVQMFNKGGEVEPLTPEEIEAASKPAFLTPKSGIGRKISTKTGELEGAALQGVSETPYNLFGAPVDLATMAMRPFGYDVEKPMFGSEDLKQRALKAGIRQKPPEGAAARALYELTQLGASAVNPAAPVRGAVAAAQKTGEAAKMLARDFQDYNQQLSVPGASYAVKPKGGTFAYTPEDLNRVKPITKIGKMVQSYGAAARDVDAPDELLEFLKTKAPKYLTTTYGTASDPLRTALRDQRIQPFGTDAVDISPELIKKAGRTQDVDNLQARIDLEKAYDNRTGISANVLKPEDSTWEFQRNIRKDIFEKIGQEGVTAEFRNPASLNAFSQSEFAEYPISTEMLRKFVENQDKLPPNLQRALQTGEPMYDAYPLSALLQPSNVVEALQQVPANKLKNMSFPEALIQGTQALAPVRDYLAAVALAEKGAKVPRQALDMFTTPVVKAPSFGGQWVTLDKSLAAKMEGKLMNHSVGDYNSGTSYGTAYTGLPYGGKKAFDEGLVRVYSLRDAEGLPKVTVEMAKSDRGKGNTWNVSQIRGRFNSEPMPEAREDIFRLLNKIDSQDGLATVKANDYARSATGERVPSTEVDWGKEYDLWKQSAE
jgi:hypothetical protein